MNKSFLIRSCFFLATVAGLAALFYLPYRTVKDKTIASFNGEQLLLTRQAAQGIEDVFAMYDQGLRYLAAHSAVVRLDERGRGILQDFYAIHTPVLLSVARTDNAGDLLFRVSNTSAVTPAVLDQAFAKVRPGPEPAVTDIFCGQTMFAAFTAPVFEGDLPAGNLIFLISFEQLVDKFVGPLKASRTRRTWVINRAGIVLDCPNPDHSGAHIDATTDDVQAAALLTIMKKMARGGEGTGAFTFADRQAGGNPPVLNHVVFMPVTLPGGNSWSLAVATPEHQVLANMTRFRNTWLLVSLVALAVVLTLGLFLIRILALAGEKKKQQRIEDQLVELMEFTPIGIIVYNMDGILQYANRTAREIWQGSTSAVLDGINVFELIHPDYRNFSINRFKDALRGVTNEPAIIKVQLPGNVAKSIETSTAAIEFAGQRCGVTVIQDVTQRLRVEEEQRRLATAIANTNDSIVITNREGTIQYVNPAFTRITGYTREEALGRNPRILKSGFHDNAFYANMWNTLLRGEVWEGRLINRKKDGSLYNELASISPVRDATGKITHFVAVKRDITHEVELESHLHQAQKMEAIGTLAGGIAHDFNNILGAIIGFTDLSLLQTPADSPIHDNLLHIRNSGRRAADLIQQILTFSRQAADRQKIPVSMAALLTETLKLLRASLPTTIDIQLHLNEPEGWVLADPVQIQQVIMNLCTNAFHAMSEKGGTLTITLERLPLADCRTTPGKSGTACIEMMVEDTGHGIDEAIIERIFDPFFTTKDPGVGTGMGLSVVHGIITDLDGMITVDSGPEGTCFTVLIPESARPALDVTPAAGEPPTGTESILVVDDERDIRETGRMMLEQLGYRVTVCEDPLQALAMIREDGGRFDLMISDQTMPGMTGTELLAEIRRIRPGLPVILCTGFSEQLTEDSARQLGARRLLMKPVSFRRLAEAVRRVLDESAEESSPAS
ncbi:MAG: PAS domain S-box protein [Thermodesulfobacteriota bacterium]